MIPEIKKKNQNTGWKIKSKKYLRKQNKRVKGGKRYENQKLV